MGAIQSQSRTECEGRVSGTWKDVVTSGLQDGPDDVSQYDLVGKYRQDPIDLNQTLDYKGEQT